MLPVLSLTPAQAHVDQSCHLPYPSFLEHCCDPAIQSIPVWVLAASIPAWVLAASRPVWVLAASMPVWVLYLSLWMLAESISAIVRISWIKSYGQQHCRLFPAHRIAN